MLINLPQFTFLCGRLGQGQGSLMREIIAQDDQVIRIDFTYPLQDFLAQMFPNTCPVVLDPLDNLNHGLLGYPTSEAYNYDFPEIGEENIHSFLQRTEHSLRVLFGDSALGILSLRYIRQHDIVQNFNRILFPDAINPNDIDVFINAFGKENCLCIHLGSLADQYSTNKLSCAHIWLAHTDTASRMSQLLKDLPEDDKFRVIGQHRAS
jgi:hypothetical protein